MVYVVSYELRTPGKNYDPLYRAIRGYTNFHDHTSCWFIDSATTAEQICTNLMQHIDQNDTVFVGRLQGAWYSYGLKAAAWLNAPERSAF